MKKINEKAFTLIELIAVILILGVIMLIAIPNVLSTIERNKKEIYITDAKTMISEAEKKIRADVTIKKPDANGITVITLDRLNTGEVEESPYDTKYCKSKSFVAIIKNDKGELEFYAHLIACTDEECKNTAEDSVAYNRGINLSFITTLSGNDRFDKVVKGQEVKRDLITDQEQIKSTLERSNINVY